VGICASEVVPDEDIEVCAKTAVVLNGSKQRLSAKPDNLNEETRLFFWSMGCFPFILFDNRFEIERAMQMRFQMPADYKACRFHCQL